MWARAFEFDCLVKLLLRERGAKRVIDSSLTKKSLTDLEHGVSSKKKLDLAVVSLSFASRVTGRGIQR